ncbi:MAG: GNAT family N-acetyltransferase [Prevotella sp.]
MRLRALEPEDLDILYSIENDPELWWLSSRTAPLSRYHLRDYIANNEGDIYKDGQVRYVIDEDGALVGLIDLFDFSPKDRRAEMGIVVRDEYRRQGLASAAIEKIKETARQDIGMHQIYVIVPVTNRESANMMDKAGFVKAGELVDWVYNGGKYENGLIMQFFL